MIETGIPMPPRRARYDFSGMKIGDSQFFEHQHSGSKCVTAARMWGARQTPVQRFMAETGVQGVRIWRVS